MKLKAPGEALLEEREAAIYNSFSGLFCQFSSSSLQESQFPFKIVSMLNRHYIKGTVSPQPCLFK